LAALRRVCLGVRAAGGPALVRATVASLRASTVALADCLVLDPEPDTGPAAAFNTLLAASDADVLVYLEAGVRTGPGWLECLLRALEEDSSYGLAGPSTNGGGPQAIVRHCGDDATEIATAAAGAARRFRTRRRATIRMEALAPFCVAVHRGVAETIGGADDRSGAGGAWCADYCARAARVGGAAVWARRSFVWCPPSIADAREPAPRTARRLRVPLRGMPVAPPPRSLHRGLPLVSCIMATRERADFALQAVRYFDRQDYPNRELVIVEDGDGTLATALPQDPRIRHVRAPDGASLGEKLNLACELARGAIIAHWDDDDWHHPTRLRTQVQPLLLGTADIVALTSITFLDLERWKFWSCTPDLYARLCAQGVCGGTLVYRRDIWEHLARYPDRSLGEDATFLERALRQGCRLAKLADEGLYLYVRHPRNTWRFECGRHVDPRGWLLVEEPSLPAADRAFYAARAPAAPTERWAGRAARGLPLVTCIMPTRDRGPYVPQAVRCFLRQDYGNRELVVLDDGKEPVRHLLPSDPRIRYERLVSPLVLGEKRNLACELAGGAIIAHWDDDDWSAPYRLSYQVAELERSGVALCGTRREFFYDARHRRAWLFEYPEWQRRRLIGNSLCYRTELWRRRPFPALAVGEDRRFVHRAAAEGVVALADHRICVGLVHADNTSPKPTPDATWRPHPPEDVERIFAADLDFYASFSAARQDKPEAYRRPARPSSAARRPS